MAAGVFTVVGIMGLAILILIGTVWVRSANRRRLDREALDFNPSNVVNYHDEERFSNSLEKLRRADTMRSTTSSNHTHTSGGHSAFGHGGYPAPPVPRHDFAQYQNQPVNNGQYSAYGQPRTLDSIYDPSHRAPSPRVPTPHIPDLSVATSGYAYQQSDGANAGASLRPSVMAQRPGSLLNTPPTSPTTSTESTGGINRRTSIAAVLDPSMKSLPPAPPLPATFGSDEGDDHDYAHGEQQSGIPKSLKVANE